MDKLFIVIPVYNEEANIKDVIEDWYPVVEKHNGNGESRTPFQRRRRRGFPRI